MWASFHSAKSSKVPFVVLGFQIFMAARLPTDQETSLIRPQLGDLQPPNLCEVRPLERSSVCVTRWGQHRSPKLCAL